MLKRSSLQIAIVAIFTFFLNSLTAATISSKAITANWLSASTWVGGVVPGQNDVAVIVNGGNITVNGNISIGSVQVNTGGTLNASSFTITIYNNWLINGSFNRGTSTVVFNGNASQSINGSAAIRFQNIVVNNANGSAGMGVTANSVNTFIYGNFEQNGVFNRNSTAFPNVKVTFAGTTIVSGITSLILHNVDILSGATLKGATGISGGSSDMYFTGHWKNLGTFVPGTGTVTVKYASSYGTQNITPGTSPFYNFTMNKSVIVDPQSNITVQNNFTILNGTWTAGSLNLNVGGDFNNAGTFTAGTGKVTLNGAGNQTVTTGGSNFYNFTINKTTGDTYQGSNVKVTNNFNLTSGILYTYTIVTTLYEIHLSNSNSSTSLTGGTSSNFIVGNLKRSVVAGAATYNFPIGVLNTSPLKYRPVTYNQTSSGGAAWVNMVADTVVPVIINSADWYVSATTNTGTPLGTITMNYNLGSDFPSPVQECILSIVRGQTGPPSNFNHVLTTTAAPAGGNSGTITSSIPATLNPFAFIVAEPLPVSTGTNICQGTSATLTANFPSGNTHFNWYDSQTGGNMLLLDNPAFITPNLFADTTFYLEYFDSLTLCSSTRLPVTITVTPTPGSTFTLPDTICRGEDVLITFSGTVSTTATYYWDFDGGILVSGSGSSNQVVYWNTPGFKNVTLSISDNPCNSLLTLNTIYVEPAPTAPVITTSDYAICQGDSVTITANGSIGGIVNYNFYDSIASDSIIGTSPLVSSPEVTTTYYLEVINEYGCKSSNIRDSITIIVYPSPTLPNEYVEGGVTICNGYSTSIYILPDTLVASSIYWWDSSTGGTFIANNDTVITGNLYNDTTFWVEAVTVNGCYNNGGRIPISVLIEPYAVSTLQSDLANNSVFLAQEMTITASPTNYAVYQFFVNNILVQSSASNTYTSYSFVDGDVVSISAITDLQCQGFITDSLTIRVSPIANAFTPNGDGYNDLFLKGLDLTVLNRWGQEMFKGTEGWDGTFKGKRVNPGTYFYIITILGPDQKPVTHTGPITLIDE